MTRTTVKRRVKLTHALVRIASGRRSVLPSGPHGRGSASRHACVALVKSNFGSRLSGAALAALGPAHGTSGVVGGVPAGCGAVRCRAVGAPRLGCAAPAAGRLRCGFTVRLRAVPLGGRGAVGAERAARSRRAAARAPRLRAPRPADRGARGAVAGAPTYLIACRS